MVFSSGLHMLAFLVEVLEKGMPQVQVPILNIIHCMLYYIDLSSPHAQPISTDLIRVIAKYLDVSIFRWILSSYKTCDFNSIHDLSLRIRIGRMH